MSKEVTLSDSDIQFGGASFIKKDVSTAPTFSGVYQIRNILDGKCYVGKAVDFKARWERHIEHLNSNWHHSIKLLRAWNKYSSDNFRFEILQECPEERLDWLEAFWMAKLNSVDNGYNITRVYLEDGKIIQRHSEETKRKISLANSNPSEETRRKHSIANLGKVRSKETLAKISKAHKGKIISEEQKQKISLAGKGRIVSDETRKKLSEAHKGKIRTPEHAKRISEALKGKKYKTSQGAAK